jgi:hypothetical protein
MTSPAERGKDEERCPFDHQRMLDDIARLEELKQTWRGDANLAEAEVCRLEADNERLRAAIRFTLDEDNNWCDIKPVLRAALKTGEQG